MILIYFDYLCLLSWVTLTWLHYLIPFNHQVAGLIPFVLFYFLRWTLTTVDTFKSPSILSIRSKKNEKFMWTSTSAYYRDDFNAGWHILTRALISTNTLSTNSVWAVNNSGRHIWISSPFQSEISLYLLRFGGVPLLVLRSAYFCLALYHSNVDHNAQQHWWMNEWNVLRTNSFSFISLSACINFINYDAYMLMSVRGRM